MSKHTRGPWRFATQPWHRQDIEAPDDAGPIAVVRTTVWIEKTGRYLQRPEQEWKANGRLITLSPEMYDFIEACARGPYPDSDLASLHETIRISAQALLDKLSE